jgi:molybdate transport system substrate-binding protein
MSSNTMKKLAFGVSAAVMMMMYSPPLRAETITISVAANFADTLTALTNSYIANVDPSADFIFKVGATTTLENQIISLGNTGAGQADLFLAANTDAPQDLYTNYSSLVVGSPFTYAQGFLVLWSNTNGVNISGGLPNPFTDDFVIANPSTAPYGLAATQLMAGSPWFYTSPIPGGHVFTSTNIGTTYQAVYDTTYKYGFVAASQVCTYHPDTTPPSKTYTGTSHHAYDSGYSAIIQNGIEINRTTRTSGETDLLNDFVAYLSSTDGLTIIQSYCYATPSADKSKSVKMPAKAKAKALEPAR